MGVYFCNNYYCANLIELNRFGDQSTSNLSFKYDGKGTNKLGIGSGFEPTTISQCEFTGNNQRN